MTVTFTVPKKTRAAPSAPDAAKPASAPKRFSSAPRSPPHAAAAEPQAAGRRARPSPGTMRYGDLLPGVGAPAPSVGGGSAPKRTRYAGPHLAPLLAATSDLNADFDLPLAFRRGIREGWAYATLRLQDEAVALVALRGNPEMRAALFETLSQPRSWAKLKQAFALFGTREFKLSIAFATREGDQASSEFATDLVVLEKELAITLTRFPDAERHGVTGIAIEDEHSRRAKRKDQAQWRALRASPAYRGEIESVVICRPPAC